jgi:iron complex outermembrane receptor protein
VNYPGRLLKADLFRSGRARLGYEYTSGQGLVRSVKATAYGYQTLHTMDNREKPTFEAGGIKPGVPSVTSDVTTVGGRLATKLVPSPTLRVTVGADGYRTD